MPWEELPHTADWALRVWAADLPSLMQEALRGMYQLLGARAAAAAPSAAASRTLRLAAADAESQLVGFLNEALFWLEEGYLLQVQRLRLKPDRLEAEVRLLPLAQVDKEIKAVTYHNLSIRATPQGWETVLVFDI